MNEGNHGRQCLRAIAKLMDDNNFVHGCTALLVDVDGAIYHIGNIQKYARDKDRAVADHIALTKTLRSLLVGVRREEF